MSTRDYLEKDYYAALGVPKDASTADVKKAYRKLARQHHPDKAAQGPDAAKAEDRFKEVSEAYAVLSDASRRKEYDEARALFGPGGAGRFRSAGGMGGMGGPGGPGGPQFDFSDLFGGSPGGGGLGDVLSDLLGQRAGAGARSRPRRGADVESAVTLPFADAVHGVTVPLRLTSEVTCGSCHGTGGRGGALPRTCPNCQGTGQTSRNAGGFALAEPCAHCRGRGMVVDDPCPDCAGTGRTLGTRVITARIPAGVKDGQRIRLKGKGAPGERGGPAGDLIVAVTVAPHRFFGRRGDHLTLTVPVTFAEAALGGEVKVPTLGSAPVTLRIPPGTANGRTFRVKGKGVPRKGGGQGDLLVTVEVAVPAKLSGKAREAVEAFRAATAGEDPRVGLLGGGS